VLQVAAGRATGTQQQERALQQPTSTICRHRHKTKTSLLSTFSGKCRGVVHALQLRGHGAEAAGGIWQWRSQAGCQHACCCALLPHLMVLLLCAAGLGPSEGKETAPPVSKGSWCVTAFRTESHVLHFEVVESSCSHSRMHLQAYFVVLPEEQVHAALADLRWCQAGLAATRLWFSCNQ
jgi:hypothetical protein